jgi:2-C-methyl-D-erythritol 4-phosphate cytidylyltransferase
MSDSGGLPVRDVALIVLVPAAGTGTRFHADIPKQYADLAGAPLLRRTLDRLAQAFPTARRVVVLAESDREFERRIGPLTGVETLRCGGPTRAATVANALALLSPSCTADDWIVVHDAARPCVPVDALLRLVDTLRDDPIGGLLATPVTDTLKRAVARDRDPRVAGTQSRDGLWQAQTPQMFRAAVLQRALAMPLAHECTDEAQAVEQLAGDDLSRMPRLVLGSTENIKVTYAADLELATLIYRRQSAQANSA